MMMMQRLKCRSSTSNPKKQTPQLHSPWLIISRLTWRQAGLGNLRESYELCCEIPSPPPNTAPKTGTSIKKPTPVSGKFPKANINPFFDKARQEKGLWFHLKYSEAERNGPFSFDPVFNCTVLPSLPPSIHPWQRQRGSPPYLLLSLSPYVTGPLHHDVFSRMIWEDSFSKELL